MTDQPETAVALGGYDEVGWHSDGRFSDDLGCTFREVIGAGHTHCSASPSVRVKHYDGRRWDGDALCSGHLIEVLTGAESGRTGQQP